MQWAASKALSSEEEGPESLPRLQLVFSKEVVLWPSKGKPEPGALGLTKLLWPRAVLMPEDT